MKLFDSERIELDDYVSDYNKLLIMNYLQIILDCIVYILLLGAIASICYILYYIISISFNPGCIDIKHVLVNSIIGSISGFLAIPILFLSSYIFKKNLKRRTNIRMRRYTLDRAFLLYEKKYPGLYTKSSN